MSRWIDKSAPGKIVLEVKATGWPGSATRARLRNLELTKADDDNIRLSIEGYWSRSKTTVANLTGAQAMEFGQALLYLAGDTPVENRGKVEGSIATYAKVEIELTGDIYCLRDDNETVRKKLHQALDKVLDKDLKESHALTEAL
jgi:hypothetical protein